MKKEMVQGDVNTFHTYYTRKYPADSSLCTIPFKNVHMCSNTVQQYRVPMTNATAGVYSRSCGLNMQYVLDVLQDVNPSTIQLKLLVEKEVTWAKI